MVSLQWKNKNSGFISLEDLVPRIVPVVIYEIQYVQYLASKILVGHEDQLGKICLDSISSCLSNVPGIHWMTFVLVRMVTLRDAQALLV